MSVRGNIARRSVGGPEFRLQPDKVLVEVSGIDSISSLVQKVSEERVDVLEESPVNGDRMQSARRQLNNLGFSVKELNNLGVIVAETDNLEAVVNSIINARDKFDKRTTNRLEQVLANARKGNSRALLKGLRRGVLNFGQDGAKLEANLRNELSNLSLRNPVTDALQEMSGVVDAQINYTRNTPGPRNLNLNVTGTSRDVTGGNDKPDVGDVLEKIGVTDAWENETGENAIAAIFDTSFCSEFLQSGKVIDTFSGPDVDNAYSAPEEGHGTMTAYSMAGNQNVSGLPYHGIARDADLLLARLSDSDGSLTYVAEAWDWLVGHIKNLDRPIISNHSYGVPLCSARTMGNCDSTTTKIATLMNQRTDHQAFYAAGNEAIYCGHRLGGITNGINGINSDPTSLASAALRFDINDAQSYSSHGFGTCNDVNQNPKPDFGCMLPTIVPYGCKEKDMSTQDGGSGAGTSEASPLDAGVGTLVASAAGTAERSVIEKIMEETAARVRPTQINFFRNHDARFGHGQVRADKAIERAMQL